VRCEGGGFELKVVNVHNRSLTSEEVRRTCAILNSMRARDQRDPLKSLSILLGDLNFMAQGEPRFKAGRPAGSARGLPFSHGTTFQTAWNMELSHWVEITQPFPTHYSAFANSCGRIDRVWVTSPTAQLLNLRTASAVLSSPEDNEAKGISDHAAVEIVLANLGAADVKKKVISRHICKCPQFTRALEKLVEAVGVLSLPRDLQLGVYKRCIWEAARVTRDHLLTHDPSGEESQRLVVDSIGRAVWRQDLKLARRVFNGSSLARGHIVIEGNNVSLVNPEAFDVLYNQVRFTQKSQALQRLSSLISRGGSINQVKRYKAQAQAFKRMRALHWPNSKRLKLAGIKIADSDTPKDPAVNEFINGRVSMDPSMIQDALSRYWSKVYSSKPIDMDAAIKIANLYAKRNAGIINFSNISLPDVLDMEATISRAKHSSTGDDGIPYCAFQSLTNVSARVLVAQTHSMATEETPSNLLDFNRQIVWFAPKGSQDG